MTDLPEEMGDMPSEPMPETQAEKSSGMEVVVPLASLAMPGEDDKMQAPSVSDPVQFQAEGKVISIDGDNARVSIEAINGKPIDAEAAKTKSTPEEVDKGEDAEFAQLKSDAANRKMY